MLMSDRLRIGLIGASVHRGWGRNAHVPAITGLPELELAAVCTAHADTAAESAAAFGARLSFSDYRAMIQHPEIDAVTIAVRVPWHHEMAIAAAEAGKHVYCEWPLAVTAQQAEEMRDAADRRGVRHVVGLQGRAAPWVRYVRDMIARGDLGEILSAHSSMFMPHPYKRADTHWAAQRSAGNHLLSIQGGHMLDMLEGCLGELGELSARLGTRVTPWEIPGLDPIDADAPDYVSLTGRYHCGAVASLHLAYVPYQGSGWKLEIYGSEGAIRASASNPSHVGPYEILIGRGSSQPEPLDIPAEYVEVPAEIPQGAPFHVAHLYRRFARAIQAGESAEPTFDDGVRRLQSLAEIERIGTAAQGLAR